MYLSADSESLELTRSRIFFKMQEKQITKSEAVNDKMAASIVIEQSYGESKSYDGPNGSNF